MRDLLLARAERASGERPGRQHKRQCVEGTCTEVEVAGSTRTRDRAERQQQAFFDIAQLNWPAAARNEAWIGRSWTSRPALGIADDRAEIEKVVANLTRRGQRAPRISSLGLLTRSVALLAAGDADRRAGGSGRGRDRRAGRDAPSPGLMSRSTGLVPSTTAKRSPRRGGWSWKCGYGRRLAEIEDLRGAACSGTEPAGCPCASLAGFAAAPTVHQPRLGA